MAENDNKTKVAAQRPGFSKEGKAYPGVDPDSGARKALTFEGAKAEFGPKRGAELYHAVAQAGGFGRVEGNPDLSLVGLDGEHKARVERLIAEAGGSQPTEAEGGKV